MSHPFRTAVESRDHAGMVAALAEDVTLWSPVSFKPFEGREAVARLFGVLLETFEDFEYVDELRSEQGTLALIFRARVGDRQVEGLDYVRFGADGLIREFTVMVRPASALMALGEAVGQGLAAAGGA